MISGIRILRVEIGPREFISEFYSMFYSAACLSDSRFSVTLLNAEFALVQKLVC